MARQVGSAPMMLSRGNIVARDRRCQCWDCGGRRPPTRGTARQREKRSWKREAREERS